VAGQEFLVTPGTKSYISEQQAQLQTDTGIKKKVEAELASRKMHSKTYQVALQYGIEEGQDERAKVQEQLFQIASDKAGELELEQERYKMLMSVHKHKKESYAEVVSLREMLNKQQEATLQQAAVSDEFELQISQLSEAMSLLDVEYKKEMQEKLQLAQTHEEELLASTERELLHTQRVEKLAAQRREAEAKHLASENQRKLLAKECLILKERLNFEREAENQRKESVKSLILNPSVVAGAGDVATQGDEKPVEGYDHTTVAADATVIPPAAGKQRKPIRAKTDIDPDKKEEK